MIWFLIIYIYCGVLFTFTSYKLLTEKEKEEHKDVLESPISKWGTLILSVIIYPMVVIYYILKLIVFGFIDIVASLFKQKGKE